MSPLGDFVQSVRHNLGAGETWALTMKLSLMGAKENSFSFLSPRILASCIFKQLATHDFSPASYNSSCNKINGLTSNHRPAQGRESCGGPCISAPQTCSVRTDFDLEGEKR